MEQQQKKEDLERRLYDVQSKLGNDATKTGEKKKGAKHTTKKEHNTSSNSKSRNSSSSSGSDSSDTSGSSDSDSDSDSENSDADQKSGTKSSTSNMQSSAKKMGQSVTTGNSLLASSGHSSVNNIKNSSNSQLKGASPASAKTLSNNNSTSAQPNPLVAGSNLQASHHQHNNIKVRNDLMPGSIAAVSGNAKGLKQQHPSNPYQGNNGLQNSSGIKGTGSSLLSSSLQKEDSPDASTSSHQTKTKAMLKGRVYKLEHKHMAGYTKYSIKNIKNKRFFSFRLGTFRWWNGYTNHKSNRCSKFSTGNSS